MHRSLKLALSGAIACLIPVLFGCHDKRIVETKDLYSPDGQVILRVEVDETGGAAVPDVTNVYLLMPNGRTASKLLFRGSAMSNFSATWRAPGQIELSYSDGYVSQCDPAPVLSADKKVSVVGCK